MDLAEFSDEGQRSDFVEDEERPAKVSRLSGSELYKPPTTEELNALRDTNMLFHSNMVKLQVTELLKEVTLPEKRRSKIDEFLHSLHDAIMGLPVTDKFKLVDSSKMFNNLQVPIHMKPVRVKGNMVCGPPADIQVVGSYLLHTNLKQRINIDLSLELPKECMQAKDYLNQRYMRKRAVYLSYVAYYLKENELVSETKFAYFMENPLKPVLLLTPTGKLSTSVTIRLHTCPGQEHFKQERFLPSKGNVRQSWFTGIANEEGGIDHQPTPNYNSLVLSDMFMVTHLKHLYESLADHEGIRDGVKLLKVWLRQRELDQGHGCFSGFLMSMLASYLLDKRRINSMMSCYQVVRNVFQFLGTSDWTTEGISMKGSNVAEFHKYFEVVFVDTTGTLNLCSTTSAAVYRQVCHEARLSLHTLDDKSIVNGFEVVFMMPIPFVRSFDHILHVSKPRLLQNSCEKLRILNHLPDHGGNAMTCALPLLTSYLKQGLGSRVKIIGMKGCQYGTWDVNSQPPSWNCPSQTISFGFILTADATSIIDKGPTAETPEAASFRDFWGDKSELRRFQDGAICEAVVWNCKNKTEKRNILQKICKHILKLHCNLPAGATSYISNQIERILTLSTDMKQKDYVPLPGYVGTGDEVNLRLIHSYNELCSHLRSLKHLPLTVVSLQGTSPALRYTEVYPPTQVCVSENQVMKKIMRKIQVPDNSSTAPPYIHPIEVICHLEGSGKWPQEVEALKRLKAAFHITFAEELEKAFKKLTCVPTQNYLDIFKDGFVFRVIIAYHREVAIMQTFTTGDGLVKTVHTPQSVELEEKTIHLPRLASALHGITQNHPSFSLTCRLAKRWINGHMLSNHIPEVVTELLCAYLYTNPHPYTEPGSALTGFLRFLWLVSTFDFNSNPMIVNLNREMQESDVNSIQEHFKSYRDSLPEMFIATPKDKTRSIWTRKQPTPMILRRLKALASVSSVEQKVMSLEREISFKGSFTGSLSSYDVIIHLEPKCVARRFECCHASSDIVEMHDAPLTDENAHVLPVVGFDPVKLYLGELEAAYSEIAVFFYNKNGGTEIGVLWRPNAFEQKDFKIANVLGASIIGEDKVAVDVNAVVEDFEIVGKGLVSKIELRTDNWKI